MKQALLLLFILLSSNALLAETLPPPIAPAPAAEMNACINGSIKNLGIVEMFSNSEAQLVSDYYESQGFDKSDEPTGVFVPEAAPTSAPPEKKDSSSGSSFWQICCGGVVNPLANFFGKKNQETLQTVKTEITKTGAITAKAPSIKRDCIEASLKREINQDAFICASEMAKAKPTKSPGPNGQCINDQYVDYIHFAVNRALSCLSPLGDPVDPGFIFQKMNNESGFNLNLAYEGGAGLGQLTSDPVQDLTGRWEPIEDPKTKKKKLTFIKGSGRDFIMDRMANTEDPKCRAFSEIAKKDLEKPPGTPPFKQDNFCQYGSIGNGVSRSLLYGIGYYLHMRENVVKPALRKRDKGLLNNKRLINLLTLVSYGPGGPRRSEELVKELRLSSNTTAEITENKVIAASDYLKNTEKTMSDMLKKLYPGDESKKDSALGGLLCVSP